MSAPQWRVVGESVCGTSHVKTGQPCQDAQGSAVLSDGTLVVAVADGAGSAIRAELGAVTAVRATIETACARLTADGAGEVPTEAPAWRSWLAGIFQAALEAVVAEASAGGHTPRDLACTLLLVIASPQRILAAQVGDGAVVLTDESGGIVALTRPSTGEYLNETTFLVTDGALDRLQCAEWRGTVSHLAALTDGLQMLALKLPGGDPHPGFFAPLFRYLASQPDLAVAQEALVQFLRSPRITARADDDLTLLLAALTPPAAGPAEASTGDVRCKP